jgi:hypothetical protein
MLVHIDALLDTWKNSIILGLCFGGGRRKNVIYNKPWGGGGKNCKLRSGGQKQGGRGGWVKNVTSEMEDLNQRIRPPSFMV